MLAVPPPTASLSSAHHHRYPPSPATPHGGASVSMSPARALPAAEEEAAARPAPEKAKGDLTCANNCANNVFPVAECPQEANGGVVAAQDEEVDVVVCDSGRNSYTAKEDDPDATEHSSSFGETFSGSGDDMSETEVDSWYDVENVDSLMLDGSNRVVRKKRVTDHWRKFIRPIMWRCQWLELRMKELHSQAILYDKELEAYKHEKQLRSKVIRLDNSASRSVPLAQCQKKQTMRRRKRKRNEETVDVSSYMSKHNVFSYYENRKPETDFQSVDDGCDDQVDENHIDILEPIIRFRQRDSSLEQILLEIESTQSRVLKLRSCLNDVTSVNAMEISSPLGDTLPGDLPGSCAQSPSSSLGNDGDGLQVDALNSPHHLSEYEIEDLHMIMPGSAVSSYGDAAELDILESNIDIFSAADIPLDQEIAGLCRDADDLLIDNQAAEEGLQNFEVVSHEIETPEDRVKEEPQSPEEANTTEVSIPEPCLGSENPDALQAPVLKPNYTGKKRGRKPKKRRRGGSIGGSGGVKNERVQKRRMG